MTQAIKPVDPAECRRRARRCREKAESSTVTAGELLEAAETWEDLARHAETLRDALARPSSPAERD